MTTPTKEEVAEKYAGKLIGKSVLKTEPGEGDDNMKFNERMIVMLQAITEYSTPLEQRIAELEKCLKWAVAEMEADKNECRFCYVMYERLTAKIKSVLKGEKRYADNT